MNETIQIIILTGSLITGSIVIMFSNQLVRKYRLPWLSSYFYYLIFLFVFGIYGVIGSYAYSLIQLFLQSRRFLDNKDRQNIRLFGLLYLIYALCTITLINLSHLGPAYGFGFIIVLFAIHLVPIFFLSLYLDKNFVAPADKHDFDKSLADFIEKYQISKRESDIVQLICKGKSNQDISDSLFISLQTVKDHIHRIYLKTGVKNRVQLTNLIRTFS
jgi:DNA-binding CsgD family transcriptional regulator